MDFELMQARAYHAECELQEMKKKVEEKERAASSTNQFLASKLEKSEKELKERTSELGLSAKAGAEARESAAKLRERVSTLESEVADSANLRQEVANVKSEMDKRCKAWENRYEAESAAWAKEKETMLSEKGRLQEEFRMQQETWESARAHEKEQRAGLKAKLQESHTELERLGREFAVVLGELADTRTINQNTFERLEIVKGELQTTQDKLQELLFAMQDFNRLKEKMKILENDQGEIVDQAGKAKDELESRLAAVVKEKEKLNKELKTCQQMQSSTQEALMVVEREREEIKSTNVVLQEKFEMALQVENNLSKRVEELTSEKESLRDQIVSLDDDLKKEREDKHSLKKQLQSLTQQLNSFSERIASLDKEKLEGSREKSQAEHDKLIAQGEVRKAEQAIASLQEKLSQSKEKQGALLLALKEKDFKIKESEKILEDQYSLNRNLQDKIQAATVEGEKRHQLEVKNQEREKMEGELDTMRVLLEDLRVKHEQTSDENRLLKQSLKLKSDIQKRMTSEFEIERQEFKSEINELNEAVSAREADIENLSARLVSLIESGEKHVNDVENWKQKVEEMRVESLRKDQVARERVAMMEEAYKKYLNRKK